MNNRVVGCGAVVLLLATTTAVASQSGEKLHAQARIAEADARATALQKVPDGIVASSELEKEHGKLIWSFDIERHDSKDITEIQVDARTGAIVSTQ
ncbi:MAG: PepSY domain-containing protein, partial [Lysobacterales bacterium]